MIFKLFFKTLLSLAIVFVVWAVLITYQPQYELYFHIGAGLMGLKFIFGFLMSAFASKDAKEMEKNRALREKGMDKVKIGAKKRFVENEKQVVSENYFASEQEDEFANEEELPIDGEDGKKEGRFLSYPDGRRIYEWDGKSVKDSKGMVLYEWDGKYFTTGLGVKLYELEGNYIKQVYGPVLYEWTGNFIIKNNGYKEYEWDGRLIKQCKGRLSYIWDGDDFPIIMAIVVLINDLHLKG
ncbi:MAG: hypothetical protein BWY78_00878 [Alphaproteobacteria bacterium ADurb.Bin438]|nr:MAG: hypothetical protein BWY78_00878 [Alphaproteobacteria bacterium ADurb.Bin438]